MLAALRRGAGTPRGVRRALPLAEITRAAYDIENYRQIMGVLARRLQDQGEDWRHVYKSLLLLEYMAKHGPQKARAWSAACWARLRAAEQRCQRAAQPSSTLAPGQPRHAARELRAQPQVQTRPSRVAACRPGKEAGRARAAGPPRPRARAQVVEELVGNVGVVEKLTSFQHKDANGRDWGLNVRQRAKELAGLVTDGDRIRAERQKARARPPPSVPTRAVLDEVACGAGAALPRGTGARKATPLLHRRRACAAREARARMARPRPDAAPRPAQAKANEKKYTGVSSDEARFGFGGKAGGSGGFGGGLSAGGGGLGGGGLGGGGLGGGARSGGGGGSSGARWGGSTGHHDDHDDDMDEELAYDKVGRALDPAEPPLHARLLGAPHDPPCRCGAKPHVRSLSSLCAAAQDPKQATRDRIAALKAAGELNDGAARDLGAIPPVPRAPGGAAAPKPGRAAAPEVLHPRRCLPRASLLRVS